MRLDSPILFISRSIVMLVVPNGFVMMRENNTKQTIFTFILVSNVYVYNGYFPSLIMDPQSINVCDTHTDTHLHIHMNTHEHTYMHVLTSFVVFCVHRGAAHTCTHAVS